MDDAGLGGLAGARQGKWPVSLRDDLIREESFVGHGYLDSKGILTLGYGFNIDKDHGGEIPLEVAQFWLDFKIRQTEDAIDAALPWWRNKPVWVQQAMTEMAYQMGVHGLLGFKDMLTALEASDYATARVAASDSQWDRSDSPARATRVIALISATDPGGQNV